MASDPVHSAGEAPPETSGRRGLYRILFGLAIGIVLGLLPLVLFPTVEEADGRVEFSIHSKSGAPIKKVSYAMFSDQESAQQAVTQPSETPRPDFYPADREGNGFAVEIRRSRRTETWALGGKTIGYMSPRYVVFRAVYEDGKEHHSLVEMPEGGLSMTVEVP